MKNNYSLTIGWLYPQLMSTYGDRGNILVLQKRCAWRGIEMKILQIDKNTSDAQMKTIDLLFGGGAQDKEQEIVMTDLRKKEKRIKEIIEQNIPALFVCGAPQLMGNYYEPTKGKRVNGLGIFDMRTEQPDKEEHRLIGNLIAEINYDNLTHFPPKTSLLVGFENHGGRTYLGTNAKPFAKVIKGFGNNGEDKTEGVVYKNAIGCYLHGPLLPKNPEVADWLISKALEIKYKKVFSLSPLNDTLEKKAKTTIANRLGIRV